MGSKEEEEVVLISEKGHVVRLLAERRLLSRAHPQVTCEGFRIDLPAWKHGSKKNPIFTRG